MTTQQPDPQSDRRDAPVDEPPTVASDSSPHHVDTRDRSLSLEDQRPPLPPRPNTLSLLNDEATPRTTLQAEPTTAVSRADVDSETPEAGLNASNSLVARGLARGLRARASLSQLASPKGSSDAGDSASIRSSIQNGDVGDVEALFKDFVTTETGGHPEAASLFHFPEFAAEEVDDDGFLNEFEPVGELDEDAGNEGGCYFESRFELRLIRSRFAASALEVEAEALSDLVGSWQTHLDAPRGRWTDIYLYWCYSDYHIVL